MKNNLVKQRWEKQIHRLLLQTFLLLNDPFLQKINITHLKFADNFHSCHIFYTVFGNFNLNSIQKQLLSKVVVIKKMMLRNWKYRHFPKLVFVPDQSLLNAEKINKILTQNDNS